METDEELAALAAPKLAKQLSGEGRQLLASISSGGLPGGAEEEVPAAIPLRRTLTKNSGAVFDQFVSKSASATQSHETAANMLRRAADAERAGQISHAEKLQVQGALLGLGVGEASKIAPREWG